MTQELEVLSPVFPLLPHLRRLVRLSVYAFYLPPGAGAIHITNATPTAVSVDNIYIYN